jgi:hypothetical protein
MPAVGMKTAMRCRFALRLGYRRGKTSASGFASFQTGIIKRYKDLQDEINKRRSNRHHRRSL